MFSWRRISSVVIKVKINNMAVISRHMCSFLRPLSIILMQNQFTPNPTLAPKLIYAQPNTQSKTNLRLTPHHLTPNPTLNPKPNHTQLHTQPPKPTLKPTPIYAQPHINVRPTPPSIDNLENSRISLCLVSIPLL